MANQSFTFPANSIDKTLFNGFYSISGFINLPIIDALTPPETDLNLRATSISVFSLSTGTMGFLAGDRNDESDSSGRLSDAFNRGGYIVWKQGNNEFELAVAAHSTPFGNAIRSVRNETILREAATFTSAFDTALPLTVELWDERPPTPPIEIAPVFGTATATSTISLELIRFKPIPPATAEQLFWEERLVEEVQKLPPIDGLPNLNGRVYPDAYIKDRGNPNDSHKLPHIVYYETGFESSTGFDGDYKTGIRVALDFRSTTRTTTSLMSRITLAKLRATGLITSIEAQNSLYDEETKLFRIVSDVIVHPHPPHRTVRAVGFRPWTIQFSRQFG